MTPEVSPDELMDALRRDEAVFHEATRSLLVRTDCWDGNIFIEAGAVTGLIAAECE